MYKRLAYCFIAGLILFSSNGSYSSTDRIARYTAPYIQEEPGTYPWIVKIVGLSACSGFLISDRHVITSAHCTADENLRNGLQVRFLNDANPFTVKTRRLIRQPEANLRRIDSHDLAILELETPVAAFTPKLDLHKYTCHELFQTIDPMAAGYQSGGILKSVDLRWSQCPRTRGWSKDLYVLKYAGVGRGGDSGAPLFYLKEDELYVMAVHEGSAYEAGGSLFFVALANVAGFVRKYIRYIDVFEDDTIINSDGDPGSGSGSGSGSDIAGSFIVNHAMSLNTRDWLVLIPTADEQAAVTSATIGTGSTTVTATTTGTMPGTETSPSRPLPGSGASTLVVSPGYLLLTSLLTVLLRSQ